MTSNSTNRGRRALWPVVLFMLGAGSASAADYAYDAPSGDWRANPINWVDTEGGYFDYPSEFDDASIGTTFPANLFGLTSNVTLTTVESARSVFLGRGANAFGSITLQPGSALITNDLYLGTQLTSSTGAVHRNGGSLNVGSVSLVNGSVLNLLPGDVIGQLNFYTGSPTASLVQPAGASTGLTLTRSAPNALTFATAGGRLRLTFDGVASSGLDWVLRVANPSGGDWVATLNGLIGSGNVVVSGSGFSVFSSPDGFTYVAVPEPATMPPVVALAVAALARRRRRRRIDCGVARGRTRRPDRSTSSVLPRAPVP
ncbi:MAG: PEP-CTERM sorting domain-containing protein [Myxococcota bacterium]